MAIDSEIRGAGPTDAAGVRLVRVRERLPLEFDAVREEARQEGFRFLDRLATDWHCGAMRFNHPGERLVAAYADGRLTGIGGLTQDPVVPGAFRMRRFYVRSEFRRGGIGRRLTAMLIEGALRSGHPVTVNAAAGSATFWESLGFAPDPRDGHTHMLRRDAAR